MEIEIKLDEDFLFYLNFTNTFLKRLPDPQMEHKCRVWLYKLIGEPCEGVDRKRCRNIYLANLLVCMQNGVLDPPFLQSPHDIDIMNATEVFGPIPDTVEAPDWLNDSDYKANPEEAPDKQGRTYIATRTLPNGQGAFAYIGVSLTDEEPMWIGAGEGSFDRELGEKYDEMVPPVYEMEKILARRRDPAERLRVLTFYDVLLQNIADELDCKDFTENETVEGLLVQLIHDLTEKGQYDYYEELDEEDRRVSLLTMLFDRVKTRRDRVAEREELLDELEGKLLSKSIVEFSLSIKEEDNYQFPSAMWEQAIDKVPTKKQMERLQAAYPVILIEKFLKCLADHKETIATRMQARHENIVTQMRKELRKEGEKKKKAAEETEVACENAVATLKAVRAYYKVRADAEQQLKDRTELPTSDHTKRYEEMKAAVFDTQKLVEEEALRGKFLAAQINAVSEQTEQFMHVNQDLLTKTEEANMKIMRSMKRLAAAIKQYESRITELKAQAVANAARASFIVQ